MAYSGQEIHNPVSGERITFLKTAADTDGELLQFELTLAPDGHVPGLHLHPYQEERFKVVDGAMRFQRGFTTIDAGAGDEVAIPPRTAHRFENAGEQSAVVVVEVRPALRMEQLLETAAALAREGRTNGAGMPKPQDLALFMQEFSQEVRAPFLPPSLVALTLAPLAWMGRRRGLDRRYTTPELQVGPARRPTPVLRPSVAQAYRGAAPPGGRPHFGAPQTIGLDSEVSRRPAVQR
ncbi:MAG: cupin domain-containing protein, partial [Actinomycetota bacterium]